MTVHRNWWDHPAERVSILPDQRSGGDWASPVHDELVV